MFWTFVEYSNGNIRPINRPDETLQNAIDWLNRYVDGESAAVYDAKGKIYYAKELREDG